MDTMPGKHRLPAKGLFIGDCWRAAAKGRAIPVVALADGRPFTEIAAGAAKDVDMAIALQRARRRRAPGAA